MILPDVNVLVYAFRWEAPRHSGYAAWLSETVATSELGLVETVLTGVVRIVTSTRIVADPAPTSTALDFVHALRAAPRARWLAPTPATWERFGAIAESDPGVRGTLVPDAWLAALAISHGCRLASADRTSPGSTVSTGLRPSPAEHPLTGWLGLGVGPRHAARWV